MIMSLDFTESFFSLFGLPREGVRFRAAAGLAFCSREPCRSVAMHLKPGQPLILRRERDNCQDSQAIRVDVADPGGWAAAPGDRDAAPCGRAAGYLYAAESCYLSLLMDYLQRRESNSCAWIDRTTLRTIVTEAPPDQPSARRLRYPKATLYMDLEMSRSWPLFTIIAMLNIKSEDPLPAAWITDNPWLQAILDLRHDYLARGHDSFRLPGALTLAWFELLS